MNYLDNILTKYSDGKIISFGFLLEEQQENTIIRVSEYIGKKESVRYIHDHTTRQPFIRLYEGLFPEKNIDQVYAATRKQVTTTFPIKLKWAEIEETQVYVILWGELNTEIRVLQLSLLKEINSLREGYYKEKYHRMDRYSRNYEYNSVKKWGWPYVTQYEPYLVIARAKSRFNLKKFEVEWNYKYCILNKFMMGIKVEPGNITRKQIIDLSTTS